MEEMFVVWFSDGNGWFASESMTKKDADVYAEQLKQEGLQVRVHPRPHPNQHKSA
ncbi:hypothetical protein [Alicyclobacillus sp. ALC3]|uniref:hypothetical protein n=1 Tax=Alicyclobacillus sp. ALC3 TaxID=2796143 RepID=UPI002377DA2C|nr:hypothetical protein [Alicyclobacillus sp. ALC3]WDL97656.1 hypothetical protein JC200_02690 [Alicyclobacillus sp. ALC3]